MKLFFITRSLIVFFSYLVVCVFLNKVNADELQLAVASNFLKPLQAIVQSYEKSSGQKILISSGSTGKLTTQILQGAPYDIFFSANASEPMRLEKEGKGIAGSRFTYAIGRLVVWSKQYKFDNINEFNQAFFDKSPKTLAIANPKTAPYGAATMEVIQKLNISLSQVRVITGDNINQTWQFLQSGNADVGFIAASQLDALNSEGHSLVIPAQLHTPIEQQVILLSTSKQIDVAQKFLNYVRSDEVRLIITRSGYDAAPQ